MKYLDYIKIVLLAITLLITIGCEDDTENEGNHIPTVKITSGDQTVNQGEKVNLSATAGDVDGDSLTYDWSIESKPQHSQAQIENSNSKNTSFITDRSGTYIVTFKANDGLSNSKIAKSTIKVNRDTPIVDNSNGTKPKLLVKEIYTPTTNSIITTTYEYNNKNQMISFHKTSNYLNKKCKFDYDNKGKVEDRFCTGKRGGDEGNFSYHSTYIYDKKDRLIEQKFYILDKPSGTWRVTEWDGDNPSKVEVVDHGLVRGENDSGEDISWTWTMQYTDGNPTYIEKIEEQDNYIYRVNRVYDNQKSPYSNLNIIYDVDDMMNPSDNYFGGVIGINNITYLENSFTFKLGTSTTTKRNEITYNSENLPIRIDTYKTSSLAPTKTEHTYTTYEYKEGK